MEGRQWQIFNDLNFEQVIKMLIEVSGSQFWEKSSEGDQIREREVWADLKSALPPETSNKSDRISD